MSRFTSIVVGTFALAIAATGCQAEINATFKTKTRFVEQNVVREDSADWAGGRIEIDVKGVGLSVNGGVKITADPSATKVRATARMLAMALGEEKENADKSIEEAKATFTLTSDGNNVSVSCGHGGTHGSSNSGESGCEYVEIVVPAGAPGQELHVKALSGNGTLVFELADATISKVEANSGSGSIDATLPATQGATISLVSERSDIAVRLPSDFSADEIILQADADKIDLGPFDDAKTGASAGGRGEAGAGLALLKLTAKEFAGSTGSIKLR